MSDIAILHELIKDTAKVSLVDNYGKKKAILTEPQQLSSSVTISNLPEDSIVIKADAFVAPVAVFNNSRGECKRADYVIIVDTDQRKVILYIETKAGSSSNKEMIQQLKGASCFIAYCREIGQSFWNQNDFLTGYTQRFISIVNTSINKKPTRSDLQAGVHDHPDRMIKISGRSPLQFNQLIGKS